ncbi:hypothetical protein ACLI1A_12065 [Flavobacterium sp. RHBU_3]|uniref:hypothetical protein n=1 Tax=Flavobacterium sp. RHBU_3 TaxID=3391184 RepID=UPI0039850A6E
MDIAAEKARLKEEIDKVTDPTVLLQIRELLEHTEDTLLTPEQIKMVEERRAEYLTNPESGIDSEDLDEEIRKRYGF